jgi:hypothetical protein
MSLNSTIQGKVNYQNSLALFRMKIYSTLKKTYDGRHAQTRVF